MNFAWFLQQVKISDCEYISLSLQVTELTNSFTNSVM